MESNKILIVDDEAIIRLSLAREIGLEKYEVDTVAGGEEAITMLRQNRYDLVITDLVMPGIDGLGVLEVAKEVSPEMCVIILTGHGNMEAVIKALRMGADDFLTKPADINELLFRIFRCLEKQSLLRQLSLQNRRLRDEIKRRQRAEKELSRNEERYRLALDASSDGLWEENLETKEAYFGERWHRTLGFSDKDAQKPGCSWRDLLHPDDAEKALTLLQEHIEGKKSGYEAEFRMKNKEGSYQWILSRGKVVARDEQQRPLRVLGTHTDITRLKHAEGELKRAQDKLEQKVLDRTTELEEINIALKVLLKKREEDQTVFEQRVLANVTDLVAPYLVKLEKSRLNDQQRLLLEILKSNISELTSSFIHKFSAKFIKLTPMEIQVADLIRQGKMTKEIAEIMNLAPGTVNIHRKNIRKKLGITHTKANLQSILSSF